MRFADHDPMNRTRFPIDEWALVETEFCDAGRGHPETLFAAGNGYLGLRGTVEEDRDGQANGTFVNGFHETWPIRHAEDAFGFARVEQTIVDAPDAKVVRLCVDDEQFALTTAEILSYERRLDLRAGMLCRSLVWRTASGKRVRITSRRMVSFTDRHLAVLDYEVELLDTDAAVTISSQVLNRQGGNVGEQPGDWAVDVGFDPRKAEVFTGRILQPRVTRSDRGRYVLGYQTTNSGMTIAVGVDHGIETANPFSESGSISDDFAEHTYRVQAAMGRPIRLTKTIGYHTAHATSPRELADRCDRTLDRAADLGVVELFARQRSWLADYWARVDVEVERQPAIQQAIRWNLFQLAQATARTDGDGVAAKGVSGSGYGGHYFWDTEVYVLPFLSYTAPVVARDVLRFRERMLPAARIRARELNQLGALFPWRTINGLESSAYYPAGTAQYHIDADISFALSQYVAATGDHEFLARGAIDILIETARMWEDLGFWRSSAGDTFHIHGVTGPDEYTTVVNDNLYTNVMARANLVSAAVAVEDLQVLNPVAYDRLVQRLAVTPAEVASWRRAAEHMHIPFDEQLGIHPQDSAFLQKEVWDFANTSEDRRPLLLHYHPLVIYRFQVLKQADVVLALYLQGDRFTAGEKLANFAYYDPLTTGDSTLSAVVQSIIAAEVGYDELALRYLRAALFVDLADLHRNTADGVHVASTGGVWSALVSGFGGFRDHNGFFTFDPRLPEEWPRLTFRVTLRGARLRVSLDPTSISFTIEAGVEARVQVRGADVIVTEGKGISVPLDGQGPRRHGEPTPSRVAAIGVPVGAVSTPLASDLAARVL